MTHAPKTRRMLRPLAPATYLVRNAGKTIPLVAVILLAVLLVCGIISLINSIPLSIRTIYAYNREFLGVTPRGDPTQTPKIVAEIRQKAPVPIERITICRATGAQVQSIVGDWPFIVVGLEQDDLRWYLQRQGMRGLVGRLPAPGAPEALVTAPVAQNLGLKLGSVLLGPDENENYSPKQVRVVGIAQTNRWLMLTSIEYLRAHHFPPIDFAMVFARNPREQERLDAWAEEHFKGSRAQMWFYRQVEERTQTMFATLYKILNVVIGALAIVITVMMGMLMNIYQSQRLVEFGLLQAIGYTKGQLLRRVMLESVMVIVLGWLFGILVAFGLLNLAKRLLMDPHAYALDVFDPLAYAYSVPIPFAILLVAVATVVLRFRRFDPVGVVERRLV